MIQNFFSAKNFSFTINRIPNVQFFVQGARIPSINLPIADQYNPFSTIKRPGNKLIYDDFSVTITLDENLESYKEIYNWMIGMSNPSSFDTYKGLVAGDGVYSDASLIALNSKGNPSIEFKFKDIFPINISSINLDTTNPTTVYATATITFAYTTFEIVDI